MACYGENFYYGDGWLKRRPGCFTPGNDPVPIVQETGWAPGPVWTGAEYSSLTQWDSIPDRPARTESLPTTLAPHCRARWSDAKRIVLNTNCAHQRLVWPQGKRVYPLGRYILRGASHLWSSQAYEMLHTAEFYIKLWYRKYSDL